MTRRARTERRALARETQKLAKDREQLARLEPGGAPERPIALASASLVEVRARAMPCAVCGGEVKIDEHAAETRGGVPLRLAHVRCPACGYARVVYFVLRPALVN